MTPATIDATAPRLTHSCVQWRSLSQPRRGTATSRDQCVVIAAPRGALALIVDGVGALADARAAGDAVVEVLRGAAHRPGTGVIPLLLRCHERLIGTRGATLGLVLVDAEDGLLSWVSVGGVTGFLMHAHIRARPPTEVLDGRRGALGVFLPPLRAVTLPIAPGDLLVMTSDGVRSGYMRGVVAAAPPAPLTRRILAEHSRGTDDATVLAARYVGRPRLRPVRNERTRSEAE